MYWFTIFYNKKSDSTFWYWMLTAFISQLSVFSFCLIAGKTKSVCAPSFDTNWSFKPCKPLLIQLRTLIPTPPHNHKKNPKSTSFPCSLKPSSNCLGKFHAHFKKLHYVSNKYFYVFLACVQHHQSWQLNQILCSNLSCL